MSAGRRSAGTGWVQTARARGTGGAAFLVVPGAGLPGMLLTASAPRPWLSYGRLPARVVGKP